METIKVNRSNDKGSAIPLQENSSSPIFVDNYTHDQSKSSSHRMKWMPLPFQFSLVSITNLAITRLSRSSTQLAENRIITATIHGGPELRVDTSENAFPVTFKTSLNAIIAATKTTV